MLSAVEKQGTELVSSGNGRSEEGLASPWKNRPGRRCLMVPRPVRVSAAAVYEGYLE